MTILLALNTTTDEIPLLEGTKLDQQTETSSKNSLGTSQLRSLKRKVRVEGFGVTEIAVPLNLRREVLRMANLIANKCVDPSDTTP